MRKPLYALLTLSLFVATTAFAGGTVKRTVIIKTARSSPTPRKAAPTCHSSTEICSEANARTSASAWST